MVYDAEFKDKFEDLLLILELDEQVDYIDSMIAADGDKVDSYMYLADKLRVPEWMLAAVYMISKCAPYNKVCRVSKTVEQWMQDYIKENYEKLQLLL